MQTKEILIKNFKNVQRGTDFILKAIPTNKLDYTPTKEMKKLGELAFHIATLPLTARYFSENEFKERPERDTILKLFSEKYGADLTKNNYSAIFAKSCEYFLNLFEKKDNNQFINGTFSNFIYRNTTSFLELFLSTEDHIVQHRGTLFAYLRTLNIPVTMQQYFGFKEL